uniref:Uncharacterized protein n=1 Tax=Naja naja TaxID=35670 RepID=A0A8C6XN30_NAJNA
PPGLADRKRQSLDNVPTVFDLVRKGILSDLEKALNLTDVNATNSANETLLHVAATHGHLEIIDYLISKGAKLEVKDNKGRTPLHRAAEKGHDKAVNRLLQAGANMYSLDQEGRTPFHLANQNQHMHILRNILKEEARRHKNQHNFLHRAALKDDSDLVQVLLKNGALVDARDERGQTALSYAVSQGHEKTVKVLGLSSEAMVSALFKAVEKDLHGIVAALIERGTDINVRNEEQHTPLLVACKMGKIKSAKVLIEKGANLKDKAPNLNSPLHLAVEAGAFSIAQMLLQKGIDPNITAQGNQTPLHVAAIYNRGALVDLLIEGGAKIDAVTTELFTPLHVASDKGHTDVALKLLQHKANVHLKNKKTPLHLAAEHGHSNLIDFLLSNGSAINALDNNKDTPLHCACKAGHFDSVRALLNWSAPDKANLQAANSLKKTPLQVAESSICRGGIIVRPSIFNRSSERSN